MIPYSRYRAIHSAVTSPCKCYTKYTAPCAIVSPCIYYI